MGSHTLIASDTFSADAISPVTTGANAALISGLASVGWVFPPASVDALRNMPGPKPSKSSRAKMMMVPSSDGGVSVRVIAPSGPSRGVYFFCHPGGFVIGHADDHDQELEHIADLTGLTALSVEYRLAPEHPYPSGLNDCEHVLRWVFDHAAERYGGESVIVAGASAGSNLALCALLRVRAEPAFGSVLGVSLLFGNYDLTFTPSARNAAPSEHLISTGSLEWFYDQYEPDKAKRASPDLSPLYADLTALPPVMLSVGSADSLIDDSLFLAVRMVRSGVRCELNIVPGGEHAFDVLPIPSSDAGLGRRNAFLVGLTKSLG